MSLDTRPTQEQRRSRTKGKIAEAAFMLVQELGYANLRTAAVAQRAGVSEGGLMHHFPNKNALAIAAVEYGLEQSKAQTAECLKAYAESDDPVRAIAKDSRNFYFTGSFEVALDILKSTRSDTELQQVITQYSREFRNFVELAWVDKLTQHGMNREDASDLVELTTSLVRGIAIRGLIQPVDDTFERLIDKWAHLLNKTKE